MPKAAAITKKKTIFKERFYHSGKFQENVSGYSFMLPFLLGVFIFQIYVFISGFYMSMTDAQGINPGVYIGLKNYTDLIQDIEFWKAVRNTFYYEIGCLVTQVPVAFILAFILNSLPFKKFQSVLRAAFFVPVLVNTIIAAWIFRQLFNPDQGIINWFLAMVGIQGRIDWLADSSYTIPLLVLVSFWQWTGFHMVYFVSQLQTIDPNLYEAARIDGATPVQIVTRITLPLMRPAFAFVMVTSVVGGLLMFNYLFMIFQAGTYGPGGFRTMVAFIYDRAFSQQLRLGYASSAGWMTFIIIFMFSLFQIRAIGLGSSHDEE